MKNALRMGLAPMLLISALAAAVAIGQQRKGAEATVKPGSIGANVESHIIASPDALKWKPGPPSLPQGSQMAVIEGDPAAPNALFTMRLKLPAGYKIPLHFHPADEHITVLQGSLWMRMGEAGGTPMEIPTGGFGVMPSGERHSAETRGEAVIQLHGVGPWDIVYVDPADDPRRTKRRARTPTDDSRR